MSRKREGPSTRRPLFGALRTGEAGCLPGERGFHVFVKRAPSRNPAPGGVCGGLLWRPRLGKPAVASRLASVRFHSCQVKI